VILHPRFKRREGVIQARVSEVPIGEISFEFPHLLVVRRRRLFFGGLIKWPIVGRQFSEPGYSGSWVIDVATGTWLGMVAGGAEDQGNTYVIEAAPLLELLTELLDGTKGRSAKLTPTSWPS